jgi:hypothetical protein
MERPSQCLKAIPLTEVRPGLWSNGHLRFDPGKKPLSWDIRLEGRDGVPVAHVRWNGVFGEFIMYTREGYIFGWDCLNDISDFIQYQNDNRVWP